MPDVATPSSPRSNPPPVGLWRRTVTTISVLTLLGLTVIAACNQDPALTVDKLRAESKTLQEIASRDGKLRIAVFDNVPYISYFNRDTGKYEGFEIEIARALAAKLGFEENRIQWVSIGDLPDRRSILSGNQVDMVVASFSMTKERREDVAFAGPYLLVPQAVLVHRDTAKPISTIEDMRGDARVCTTTGSTSEKALKKQRVYALPVDESSQCMAGMRSRKYDAFSADLPILAALDRVDEEKSNQDRFKILDLAIADTDEKIGVAVAKDDLALRDLLAYFLHRWQTGPEVVSPWLRAYDSTIGPLLPPEYRSQPDVEDPPDLVDHDSKAPQA